MRPEDAAAGKSGNMEVQKCSRQPFALFPQSPPIAALLLVSPSGSLEETPRR